MELFGLGDASAVLVAPANKFDLYGEKIRTNLQSCSMIKCKAEGLKKRDGHPAIEKNTISGLLVLLHRSNKFAETAD